MASPTCDGHVEFLLRLGDSALVLSQRLGEWVGNAPMLEEEVALANIALDLLGQATLLLDHAGDVEGSGRDADQLAYLRDAAEYRNLLLAERPNGDFAHTIVRQVLYETWALELWNSLLHSEDEQLAGIAGKAVKETEYHLRHVAAWLLRLAGGTAESRSRTERALEELWPYAGEAVLVDEVDDRVAAAGIAPLASSLEQGWRQRLDPLLAEADLTLPESSWVQRGGKQGHHTEALGFILAELQFLQRAYPGATW